MNSTLVTTSFTAFFLLIFTVSIAQNRNIGKLAWWNSLQTGEIQPENLRTQDKSSCSLSQEQKQELNGYKEITLSIVKMATDGDWAGRTYRDLETFVDKFGSRLSGSDSLEKSIDYMIAELEKIGLTNVHGESVVVPKWIRGEEEAHLISPRNKSLAVMALGYSVPTPPEGITAPVFVANSFKAMMDRQEEVAGKIVVYSTPKEKMEGHLHTMLGAAFAAKFGAIAALARTSTPFSLNTPHVGIQFYRPNIPRIPIAALSPEDGDLIGRIAEDGENITIHLRLEILENTVSESRNIIGDLPGREKPDEFVVVSGHIDSWDVGQGASDDGVGVMLAYETVKMLKTMDLIPRRTLRTIMWTAEEMGLFGANKFMVDHHAEFDKYSAALEADYGCFAAIGFLFTGHPQVGCILQEILDQTALNVTEVIRVNYMPTDVSGFNSGGVPSIVLHGDDGHYFWYHHTEADVITAVSSKALDICLGIWASASYIIADLKEKLPREENLVL